MDMPASFAIQTGSNDIPLIGQVQNEPAVWTIPDFFKNVSPEQPYLQHYLLITNIEQQTSSSGHKLFYTLLNEKDNRKGYGDEGFAEIVLQETKGEFSIKAKSSLFVYRSFPTFRPEDFIQGP